MMANNNILNRFAVNPVSMDIPRSKFSLDHSVKFSANVGNLIPFCWFDVLPGSTFTVDTSKVIRMQPLVYPIMDNVYLDTYWFFVPYRLIWSHFVNFMGENTSTAWTPSTQYNIPKIVIPSGGYNVGTVADYLGIPPGQGAGRKINALPFRAYALIANEWFRSTSLMNPVHVTTGDSDVTGVNTSDQVTDVEKGGAPFIVCKYFDLFTAALPSPQRGPAATFSLAGMAPVIAKDPAHINYNDTYTGFTYPNAGIQLGRLNYETNKYVVKGIGSGFNDIISSNNRLHVDTSSMSSSDSYQSVIPMNLYTDLSTVTQFNVNELRMAFAVQRYYEALARGGDRYIEQVKEFFGVTSSDYRFMRPEYLGGNRVPIEVAQVTQTSETTTNGTPLGQVAGMSVTGDVHSDFSKSFTEHGIIIGCCVARYNHTYQQGVEKYFLKDELTDFYNPKFANIGEQPVMTDEIFYGSSNNDTVFGYNEAWYEYRFKPSRVCGEMRSVANISLDAWHLADNYQSAPSLSASWIREDKSNLDRCLAVTSEVANQFVCDFYIKCETAQPMPMYSIPGLIDHH